MARKDLGKTRHLEDRTLSDVAEEKNFDWLSKERVTSEMNVSPPKKFNSRESSKDNDKESCDSNLLGH